MENGAIPDNKIAATSELSAAKNGRLNYTSGSSWCARPSNACKILFPYEIVSSEKPV